MSLTLDDVSSLDAISQDLRQLGDVEVSSKKALICLVGNNLKYTPGVARRAFGSLSDINILMVSHGASNINFSFLIDEKDANTAIQKLHADFFSEIDPEVFEPVVYVGAKYAMTRSVSRRHQRNSAVVTAPRLIRD